MRPSRIISSAIILAAQNLVTFAQPAGYSYPPLVEEGKSWTIEEYNDEHTEKVDEYTYYISGDTLIESDVWKKVFRRREGTEDAYVAAVKEDGGAVYALAPHSAVGYIYRFRYGIVSDFSLHVGDAIYTAAFMLNTDEGTTYQSTFSLLPDALRAHEDHREVVGIDTITVRGQARRRFTMKSQIRTKKSDAPERIQPTFAWVEGIGPETGLFVSHWKKMENFRITCSLNGDTLFESKDFRLPVERPESRRAEPVPAECLPLVEDGKSWQIEILNNDHTEVIRKYTYSVSGDSLIDGQVWKKVHLLHDGQEDYYAGLRQEGPLVYALPKGNDPEQKYVLYDFSVKVGYGLSSGLRLLTIPDQYYLNNLEIIRIDTVCMYGQSRRRYEMEARLRNQMASFETRHDRLTWIEGIGSNAGLFVPDVGAEFENFRVVCTLHGQEIFRMGDFVGPDGAVQARPSTAPGALYDLQGRRLAEPPQRGLYIRGGRVWAK